MTSCQENSLLIKFPNEKQSIEIAVDERGITVLIDSC